MCVFCTLGVHTSPFPSLFLLLNPTMANGPGVSVFSYSPAPESRPIASMRVPSTCGGARDTRRPRRASRARGLAASRLPLAAGEFSGVGRERGDERGDEAEAQEGREVDKAVQRSRPRSSTRDAAAAARSAVLALSLPRTPAAAASSHVIWPLPPCARREPPPPGGEDDPSCCP